MEEKPNIRFVKFYGDGAVLNKKGEVIGTFDEDSANDYLFDETQIMKYNGYELKRFDKLKQGDFFLYKKRYFMKLDLVGMGKEHEQNAINFSFNRCGWYFNPSTKVLYNPNIQSIKLVYKNSLEYNEVML